MASEVRLRIFAREGTIGTSPSNTASQGPSTRDGKAGLQAVLCFCHLRWNFVYQRPQHLLSRAQRLVSVHLWEEPLFQDRQDAALSIADGRDGVRVITPLLPHGLSHAKVASMQRNLLDGYVRQAGLRDFCAWYYTPMALSFSDHLTPSVVVYDCMDELSAFDGAPPELMAQERRLFDRADVVFTGGASLYAAKRSLHENIHLFPSSVDREHFSVAQQPMPEPADQAGIPHPRIGFYGVLDERLDRDLLSRVAGEHPEWQFVLIGPVVKIRDQDLPRLENIHYLGQKTYAELPGYLSNWEMAMLPFAQNASTKFISPTKTPEYLAAHKPVVSTPIRDVVTPYGDLGLVRIGGDTKTFAQAIERGLADRTEVWEAKVEELLSGMSWDRTFESMWTKIEVCYASRHDLSECLAT